MGEDDFPSIWKSYQKYNSDNFLAGGKLLFQSSGKNFHDTTKFFIGMSIYLKLNLVQHDLKKVFPDSIQ